MRLVLPACLALFTLAACHRDPPPSADPARTTSAASDKGDKPATEKNVEAPIAAGAHAAVGQPAPDFTLKDLDGKAVHLADFKGKVVVLEWFNPGCPFVKKSHTKGSLKDAAGRLTKDGVVWLAVNSGAPGKQGAGADANREGQKAFGLTHPILLDETGDVGKAYGATNTPHMFVIDDKGILQYRGAIDNSPDGELESAPNGKVVAYVDEAVTALRAGKSVANAETKAYGCSVKYGK